MISNLNYSYKRNQVRTKLLIITNEEAKETSKNTKTKINSKTCKEFETEFFNIVINLESEYFSSDFKHVHYNNTMINTPFSNLNKSIRVYSQIQNDENKEALLEYISNLNCKKSISSKKLGIIHKKDSTNVNKEKFKPCLDFFFRNETSPNEKAFVYSKNYEDKIDIIVSYLNRNISFLFDEYVSKRVKRGFLYLQSLVFMIKNSRSMIKGKSSTFQGIRDNILTPLFSKNEKYKVGFNMLKQILLLKENIDEKKELNSIKRHTTVFSVKNKKKNISPDKKFERDNKKHYTLKINYNSQEQFSSFENKKNIPIPTIEENDETPRIKEEIINNNVVNNKFEEKTLKIDDYKNNKNSFENTYNISVKKKEDFTSDKYLLNHPMNNCVNINSQISKPSDKKSIYIYKYDTQDISKLKKCNADKIPDSHIDLKSEDENILNFRSISYNNKDKVTKLKDSSFSLILNKESISDKLMQKPISNESRNPKTKEFKIHLVNCQDNMYNCN